MHIALRQSVFPVVSFFDHEPDISPSAPFIMRRALHVQESALFIVRVSGRDKFGECGGHMDIVRDKQAAFAEAPPKLAKLPPHMAVAMRAVMQKHVDLGRYLIAAHES